MPLTWMRQADTIRRLPSSPSPAAPLSPVALALLVVAIVLAVAVAVKSAQIGFKRLGPSRRRALGHRCWQWASQVRGFAATAAAWRRAGTTRTRVASEVAEDANEAWNEGDVQPDSGSDAVSKAKLLGSEPSAAHPGGSAAAKSACIDEDAFELNAAAAMSQVEQQPTNRLDHRSQATQAVSSVPPWVARADDMD